MIMHPKIHISNIKCSFKVDHKWEETISKLKSHLNIKYYPNFVVIRIEDFCFTLFKAPILGGYSHLNITKIRSFEHLLYAAQKISEFIDGTILYDTLKVDNITASSHLHSSIDIRRFVESQSGVFNISLNQDRFPGCFIRSPLGTAILFHTGRLIIVGSKSTRDIKCVVREIQSAL